MTDPTLSPRWNESIVALPSPSLFHTAEWAAVLKESYGYLPVYFTIQDHGAMRGLLPVMEVQSFLTGTRGVSLPFTDYCEPLLCDAARWDELLAAVVAFAHKRHWRYVELRGGEPFLQDKVSSASFFGHELDLSQGSQKILSKLRDSTRRNIKKAIKEKVHVTISNSADALADFCRLNAITRKNHGLPMQPFLFFQLLYDTILSKNRGFIATAFFEKKAVAANIYLCAGKDVLYKYGASDRAYQHLRANNLVMWESIQWSCDNGYTSLYFGRTDRQHEGLRQFKAGWGAREYRVKYYRYDLRKSAFAEDREMVHPLYNRIFGKLPLPVLQALGNILYRHFG